MHVGSVRRLGNAGISTQTQEKYLQAEAGRLIELGEDPENWHWKKTWIDKVNKELHKHQRILAMPRECEEQRTSNKTIIEYAKKCAMLHRKGIEFLENMNFV